MKDITDDCLNDLSDYRPATTSTLNGQWPSDTWFRRALARKLKAQAQELESEAANEKKA